MADILRINPKILMEFIDSMYKKCQKFRLDQATIEKSFFVLGNTWGDAVYCGIGNVLYRNSVLIMRVYEEISKSLRAATEYYNLYMEAQGYRQRIEYKRFPPFEIKIKGDNMEKKFDESNVTDLDAMSRFIKELGEYIDSTERIMKSLSDEYLTLGVQKAWDAPQYRQLGTVLDELYKRINSEISKLRDGREITKRKYKILYDLKNSRL